MAVARLALLLLAALAVVTTAQTLTPTQTASKTAIATNTVTQTASRTGTSTGTGTQTGTQTQTQTPSRTATQTGTGTQTPTQTASRTGTSTGSQTAKPTPTGTGTPTPTVTPTGSMTAPPTRTGTGTQTPTASQTGTQSSSASQTGTPSSSQTATGTSTATGTRSRTGTRSPTRTGTGSRTGTQSATASQTATGSETGTQSPSQTASLTASPSSTGSTTSTQTATPTQTPSGTRSGTRTSTGSRSPTPSLTGTRSGSPPPTGTPAGTGSPSGTGSGTPSGAPTGSASGTGSPTPSGTPPPTGTPSETGSAPGTPPGTPSATGTASQTRSDTPSPSGTRTAARTPTGSQTPPGTGTGTPAGTPPPSSPPSGTPSGSGSRTESPPLTGTPSLTGSVSVTPPGTPSGSETPSPPGTASPTATPSRTASASGTGSATASASDSASTSGSPSASATVSVSATPPGTPSASGSTSLSATPPATPTGSATATGSATGLRTRSPSRTPPGTPAATAAATGSPTASVTPSPPATASPSRLASPSRTASPPATSTRTPSTSPTPSPPVPAASWEQLPNATVSLACAPGSAGCASALNFCRWSPENVRQQYAVVALSASHGCAIEGSDGGRAGRDVRCWGNNSVGQAPLAAVRGPFAHVAVIDGCSCGLRADSGVILCWGATSLPGCPAALGGQASTVPAALGGSFTHFALSPSGYLLAVTSNRTARCYGPSAPSAVPPGCVDYDGYGGVKAVYAAAVSGDYACVLHDAGGDGGDGSSGGRAVCFGSGVGPAQSQQEARYGALAGVGDGGEFCGLTSSTVTTFSDGAGAMACWGPVGSVFADLVVDGPFRHVGGGSPVDPVLYAVWTDSGLLNSTDAEYDASYGCAGARCACAPGAAACDARSAAAFAASGPLAQAAVTSGLGSPLGGLTCALGCELALRCTANVAASAYAGQPGGALVPSWLTAPCAVAVPQDVGPSSVGAVPPAPVCAPSADVLSTAAAVTRRAATGTAGLPACTLRGWWNNGTLYVDQLGDALALYPAPGARYGSVNYSAIAEGAPAEVDTTGTRLLLDGGATAGDLSADCARVTWPDGSVWAAAARCPVRYLRITRGAAAPPDLVALAGSSALLPYPPAAGQPGLFLGDVAVYDAAGVNVAAAARGTPSGAVGVGCGDTTSSASACVAAATDGSAGSGYWSASAWGGGAAAGDFPQDPVASLTLDFGGEVFLSAIALAGIDVNASAAAGFVAAAGGLAAAAALAQAALVGVTVAGYDDRTLHGSLLNATAAAALTPVFTYTVVGGSSDLAADPLRYAFTGVAAGCGYDPRTTPTPAGTPSASASPSASAPASASVAGTPPATASSSRTPARTPSGSRTPSRTGTGSPSGSNSGTASASPSATATPSGTPSALPQLFRPDGDGGGDDAGTAASPTAAAAAAAPTPASSTPTYDWRTDALLVSLVEAPDVDYSFNTTSVALAWEPFEDVASGISSVGYCLGSRQFACDVAPWTLAASVKTHVDYAVVTGLSIAAGSVLYATVAAVNGVGLVSMITSDGLYVDDRPPALSRVLDTGKYFLHPEAAPGGGTVLYRPPVDINCDVTGAGVGAAWKDASAGPGGIGRYEWAVGSAPNATDILPWTDVGSATAVYNESLLVPPGVTYYASVRAVGPSGLVAYASSNGALVLPRLPSRDGNATDAAASVGADGSTATAPVTDADTTAVMVCMAPPPALPAGGLVAASSSGTSAPGTPADGAAAAAGDEWAGTPPGPLVSSVFGLPLDMVYPASATRTASRSATATASSTRTASATPSTSLSASVTASTTGTGSITASASATASLTPSTSLSSSATATGSVTASQSPTGSLTASASPSASVTPSASLTGSNTPSVSLTSSLTPSASLTASVTPTSSLSVGASPSSTESQSATATPLAALPAGALQNVPLADLYGWRVCHTSRYMEGAQLAQMLSDCDGGQLMLACRPIGSDTLTFAAWALTDDVLRGTEWGASETYNGVQWVNYYYALAAAPADAPLPAFSYSCPGSYNSLTPMLCWSRYGGYVNSGGQCGYIDGYATHERVVLAAPLLNDGVYPDPSASRTPTPTRSTTGSPTASLSGGATPSVTPSPSGVPFTPLGPQTNVPLAALAGWRPCYSHGFSSLEPYTAADVLAACTGPSLLMGCMVAGADTLALAAWGAFEDVTYYTGNGAGATRDANGVSFYYGASTSWGFAGAGSGVYRSGCDYSYYPDPQLRMCLDVYEGRITGGYRCGEATGVYTDDWLAVWYVADDALPYATPTATGSRTLTPSASASPSLTPSVSSSASASASASDSPSSSLTPGAPPSATPTASSPVYAPLGPQVNVPLTALTGWTQCHASDLGGYAAVYDALAACTGPSLMMACRPAGSETLTLLAWASVGDVTLNVGDDPGASHWANGAQFYYGYSSWGFANGGDGVVRQTCDVAGGDGAAYRLCFHTGGGWFYPGYRCGSTSAYFGWERVLFSGPALGYPPPSLTATPAGTPPVTASNSPSASVTPSRTPTRSVTSQRTPTRSATALPTASLSPGAAPSATPSRTPALYVPYGPQVDVPLAALTGWRRCFASSYADYSSPLSSLFDSCSNSSILMGCRRAGSSRLDVAAWGPRAVVFQPTGDWDPPLVAAGTGWYYTPGRGIGFVPAGADVYRAACDVFEGEGNGGGGVARLLAAGVLNASDPVTRRMCVRLNEDSMAGGFRCGTQQYLYDPAWERLFFHSDAIVYPTPSSTATASATATGSVTASSTRTPSTSPTASLSTGASPSPSLTGTSTPTMYLPYGPQTGVPASALTGWAPCHVSSYADSGVALSVVLEGCAGNALMLACRESGSDTYALLAWAPRGDVLYDVGSSATSTRSSNGAQWYYSADWSWGFANGGDPVSRSSCDTAYDPNPGLRMCLHTGSGYLNAGYRCGYAVGLYGYPAYERVVLSGNVAPTPSPSPSASPAPVTPHFLQYTVGQSYALPALFLGFVARVQPFGQVLLYSTASNGDEVPAYNLGTFAYWNVVDDGSCDSGARFASMHFADGDASEGCSDTLAGRKRVTDVAVTCGAGGATGLVGGVTETASLPCYYQLSLTVNCAGNPWGAGTLCTAPSLA